GNINERLDLVVVPRFRNDDTSPRMADQDDRTFRIPDRPPGGGGVILQRVERVLDRNDLEADIFKIRNDFVPGRPVSKRTVDQDYRFGFQFGSPSWEADCAHRTQEDAQANNTFVEFHGYTPWFGGDPSLAIMVVRAWGTIGRGASRVLRSSRPHRPKSSASRCGNVWFRARVNVCFRGKAEDNAQCEFF